MSVACRQMQFDLIYAALTGLKQKGVSSRVFSFHDDESSSGVSGRNYTLSAIGQEIPENN
jgi:hypothetical protein